MTKKEKRFQECNGLEKLWRYRWYLPIPFQWLWKRYVKPLKITETEFDEEKGYIVETNNVAYPKGKLLWSLLVGQAQGKMRWYWTGEEVWARLRMRREARRNEKK